MFVKSSLNVLTYGLKIHTPNIILKCMVSDAKLALGHHTLRSGINVVRRNCHHFTPPNIPKRPTVNMNDIFTTIQNHTTEIAELYNQFAKVQKNMNYKMATLEYKIFGMFTVNCVLMIYSLVI